MHFLIKNKVRGVDYSEIKPLVKRFYHKDPTTGKGKIKIDPKGLLSEAQNFFTKQQNKKHTDLLRGKKGNEIYSQLLKADGDYLEEEIMKKNKVVQVSF